MRVAIAFAVSSAGAVVFTTISAGSATVSGTSGPASPAGQEGSVAGVVHPFPAQAFSGRDLLTHRPVSLAGLKGQVVVLEFWESWCGPCRGALVSFEKAARAKPVDVAFVGVDVSDRRAPAVNTLKGSRVTLPNIADPSGSIAAAYRVRGTPTFVLIGTDGRVHAEGTGPLSPRQILLMATG